MKKIGWIIEGTIYFLCRFLNSEQSSCVAIVLSEKMSKKDLRQLVDFYERLADSK